MAASQKEKPSKEGLDDRIHYDFEDNYWSVDVRPRVSIFDEDFGMDEDGFHIFGISKKQASELSKSFRSSAAPDLMDDVNDWDKLEISSAIYRSSTSSARYQTSFDTKGGETNSVLDLTAKDNITSQKRPTFSREQTLADHIETSIKKPTLTEVTKLQSQVERLKRSLDEARRNRWAPIPVAETIRSMITGQPYYLFGYRAKADKLTLLDSAIKCHDGNIITAAVLFLKNTSKSSIFRQEIIQRPEAVTHYLHYLQSHHEFSELADALSFLGRIEEAAILEYKLAILTTNIGIKVLNLRKCDSLYFNSQSSLMYESHLVNEHLRMLEIQQPIDAADGQLVKEGKLSRIAPVLDKPLITMLHYCCLYHYSKPENLLASPLSLKKKFHLSDKQYAWVVLRSRSQLQEWKDIRDLLIIKKQSIFGSKPKSCLPLQRVVEYLYKAGAPTQELEVYLNLIDNTEQRLEHAKKSECYKVVIDTLISLRDRQQLEQYASKVPRSSNDSRYLADALRNSTIKWKT